MRLAINAADTFIPKEALEYFKSKNLLPGFDYRDVWRYEHAHHFTVAKMMEIDTLSDVQGLLTQALEEGKTFKWFQAELTPYLQKKGWWGRKDVIDPKTGKLINAQLGSPRRLKIIYDTNMRTARAAGQWERIERTKAALPYLLYQLGPSENHRLDHIPWNGLLLPVDHVFWETHTPPNGWG